MKTIYLALFSFFFIVISCNSYKYTTIQKEGENEVIQKAILDFSRLDRVYKKDSVFSVNYYQTIHRMVLKETTAGNAKWIEGQEYKGVLAVSISASYNKILLADNVKVGDKGVKMPTRFF